MPSGIEMNTKLKKNTIEKLPLGLFYTPSDHGIHTFVSSLQFG